MKRCHAETYCKQYNEDKSNCHEYCIGFIQLQNIYALSNMPMKYQFEKDNELRPEVVDHSAFISLRDWKNNVLENVEKGRGVFIYSTTKGNGKTTWVCKLMNEYFKKVALKNNLRCRGLFINVPQFLEDLKRSFDNPDEKLQEMIQNIKTADIVIWDDIGTETPTSWVRTLLYSFINERDGNLKSQFFTSNVSLEQMEQEEWLGERIVSRIVGCTDLFEFTGTIDRRVRKDG